MQGGGALIAGSVVDDAARCAAIADVSLSCPIKLIQTRTRAVLIEGAKSCGSDQRKPIYGLFRHGALSCSAVPTCLALRDLLPTAGDRQRGRDFCADIRDRAQSLDGLTRVVDLSMSSVIAEAAMNRRQPRTTLGRFPERRSS